MKINNSLLVDSMKRLRNAKELIKATRAKAPIAVEKKETYARRLDFIKKENIEPLEFAKERLIGDNDLLPVSYLERGSKTSKSVGLVKIFDQNNYPLGMGTCFLITERLIITNNHVIGDKSQAINTLIEFNYERDLSGQLETAFQFQLRPNDFFYTNKKLDYTVVAVSPVSSNGKTQLSSFGCVSLNPSLGKITKGECVSIIQHPEGREKQIAIRENQILEHESPDFLWYFTDTTPGSSGSPVFNDQWNAVALHHMGVPKEDAKGYYLKKDGTKVKPDADNNIDLDGIDWLANEGVRVSSIVKDLMATNGNNPLIKQLNTRAPQPKESIPPTTTNQTQPTMATFQTNNLSNGKLTIPLTITVSVGNGEASAQVNESVKSNALDAFEKSIVVDQNYKNRKGYNERFLGKRIPLPDISAVKSSVAYLTGSKTNYELKYEHHSNVINKDRLMPFFGAAMFDGELYDSIVEQIPSRKEIGTDKWYEDTRIDPKYQLSKNFYAGNDWDVGHQVRREEPVWGKTLEEAIKANNDTFHLTNACPQYKDFNQGKTMWQGIENYVLDNARQNKLRVVIMTGPVFGTKDRKFTQDEITARIPEEFWKIVIWTKSNGQLSASGYLASQRDQVDKMLEEFVFGPYRNYQVPLSLIEKKTKLKFGLSDHDPKEKLTGSLKESMSGKSRIQLIQSTADLEF